LNLLPVTVVDNFFKDPDSIRARALSLTFEKGCNAPGPRTICPPDIADIVCKKIFALLIDMNKHIVEGQLDLSFQLTTKDFEHGWVHSDVGGNYFAGVIYLTPNAPLSGGTSMYKPVNDNLNFNLYNDLQRIKSDFYTGKTDNLEQFKETRKENNSLFYKTIEVSNIYNRLVMYPVNEFHSENILFGDTREDSRLTIVFFVKNIASNSMLPIDRMNFVGE
jgi:hypothetical protein